MRYFTLIVLLFFTTSIFSQRFTEIYTETNPTIYPDAMVALSKSQPIYFHDVNGDKYPDALVSGKLYINNKKGGFNANNISFPSNTRFGDAKFEDVNGDTYVDILMSGIVANINGSINVIKLFINDGQGNFKEKENTPFVARSQNSINFGDINGDKIVDVLISGAIDDFNGAKLYINDGAGNFTAVILPFPELEFSKLLGNAVLLDIDGDVDNDVLVTSLINPTARLGYLQIYINNGNGVFTKKTSPFVWGDWQYVENIISNDLNGDLLPDLVLSGGVLKPGTSSTVISVSRIWLNNGGGKFTEIQNNIEGIQPKFIYVNQDAYLDLVLGVFGSTPIGIDIVGYKAYTNNGSGKFTEVSVPFNNDKKTKLSITNLDNSNRTYVFGEKVYAHNVSGIFEVLPPVVPVVNGWPFFALFNGNKGSFIDANNDKHQDVILTGQPSKLLINDGKGNFTPPTDALTTFNGYTENMAVSDVNGDKYQDVLLTGSVGTKLFLSDGKGKFTEVPNTTFVALNGAVVAFADLNGDKNPDFMITGYDKSNVAVTKMYTNDGVGKFTEVPNTTFKGSNFKSLNLADLNGDEYVDVLIDANLYINNGKGIFAEALNIPFTGSASSYTTAVADVNGDKSIDVLFMGSWNGVGYTPKIYINNGKGLFTENPNAIFDQISQAIGTFIDADHNQYTDVVISGFDNKTGTRKAELYLNDGKGGFNKVNDTPLLGLTYGSISVADVNGDMFDDMLLMGFDGSKNQYKLYLNNKITTSTLEHDEFLSRFTLYPNPLGSGSPFNLKFTSAQSNRLEITLFDIVGRQVHNEQLQVSAGQNEIAINLPNMAAGVYILRMNNGVKAQSLTLVVK